MPKMIDLKGHVYGSLTVLNYSHTTGAKRVWTCQCVCGVITEARGNDLRTGQKTSCGCSKLPRCLAMGKAKRTSRHTHLREWNSWIAMKQRCNNPGDTSYHNYGARGISYPEEWEDFEVFLKDLGPRPEGTSLEREKNNQNYSKDNCRWATYLEQGNNKRNNVYVYVSGKKLSLAQADRALGLGRGQVRRVIRQENFHLKYHTLSLTGEE